jgi:hypothetical protein
LGIQISAACGLLCVTCGKKIKKLFPVEKLLYIPLKPSPVLALTAWP